jgi:hypothetical protein
MTGSGIAFAVGTAPTTNTIEDWAYCKSVRAVCMASVGTHCNSVNTVGVYHSAPSNTIDKLTCDSDLDPPIHISVASYISLSAISFSWNKRVGREGLLYILYIYDRSGPPQLPSIVSLPPFFSPKEPKFCVSQILVVNSYFSISDSAESESPLFKGDSVIASRNSDFLLTKFSKLLDFSFLFPLCFSKAIDISLNFLLDFSFDFRSIFHFLSYFLIHFIFLFKFLLTPNL